MIEYYKNYSLENLLGEIWKDISGYEGYYQISNLGRVKSLERWVSNGVSQRKIEEKIRVPVIKENGYLYVILQKSQSKKMFFIHRLVMEAFIGVSRLDIDHLDSIKTNNTPSNLEYVSHRENIRRYVSKGKNLPVGVSKDGISFRAAIFYNGKLIHLGVFASAEEAGRVYSLACSDLENIHKYIVVRNPKSIYGRGIHKNGDSFIARIQHNKKCHYLRGFKTPEEAQEARKKFLENLVQ